MNDIKELAGKTLVEIDGALKNSDEIVFVCDDGTKFRMHHYQGCCESVSVEDIIGDINDLLNTPIIKAEKTTSRENPEGISKEYQDSFTWTFYHIATIKGYVTIRWYGESNGYYSEEVSFERI